MTMTFAGAPLRAPFDLDTLLSGWASLSESDRRAAFEASSDGDAADLFLGLDAHAQAEHLLAVTPAARRLWARMLPPDDAADVVQKVPPARREEILAAFDATTRAQVEGLLAFAEDEAGGLMDPRPLTLRPDLTVDQAIAYVRRVSREASSVGYYAYVLDGARLVGVVSLRDLLRVPGARRVDQVMHRDVVTVAPDTHQAETARIIARYDLLAVPVVDAEGRLRGVVSVDDVVDVLSEQATEDIQKLGGTSALEAPYLDVGFWEMMRKRAGWLSALFLGEMLTATAMAYFEHEIARAVVLALFIPLIISSGGNSGSQASTLLVRALGVGDVRLRDWARVFWRELRSGIVLGGVLAAIGFTRIVLWPGAEHIYGANYVTVALTVAASLVGVVLWGTLAGSMLPFVLRRVGFDPATASAPLVATLVDVTGLVIYFSVASVLLSAT